MSISYLPLPFGKGIKGKGFTAAKPSPQPSPEGRGRFTAHYFFNNPFAFKKAITASLNCFGFSMCRKWPTPSHI